jgi:hypothetical protein
MPVGSSSAIVVRAHFLHGIVPHRRSSYPRSGSKNRQKEGNDTDRESRADFDRQASATKSRLLPWSLPILMSKTVFGFASFHSRATQAWISFLVAIECGAPMPG